MPVSAELGPLAPVIERAGRPDPAERSTAAELGKSLIAAAEKLPRPAPLPLVATSTGPVATEPERGQVATSPQAPVLEPAGGRGPGSGTSPAVMAPTVVVEPAPPPPSLELFDQEGDRPSRTLRGYLLAILVLVVAAGVGVAALFLRTSNASTYPVEGLVGLQVGEARNRIATYGWDVREVREKNDTQPLDVVFRTDPESGELREGRRFTMYVSDGPTPSVLPPLVGESIEDAKAALDGLQLKLAPAGQQFSESAPAGTIMAFTVGGLAVQEGASVEKGSTVNVVVSAGPEPRTIPQLAGMAPAQAEQALKALRLVPAKGEDVFNALVPAGAVASTNPPAGTKVPRDSNVVYQLSKGADVVTVPNLVGMSVQQAKSTLAAAGLVAGTIKGDPSWPVLSTAPAAGTKLPRGSAVAMQLFPSG
jgi:serine/threonine-protein kinase